MKPEAPSKVQLILTTCSDLIQNEDAWGFPIRRVNTTFGNLKIGRASCRERVS
jgi:hypothetical protein